MTRLVPLVLIIIAATLAVGCASGKSSQASSEAGAADVATPKASALDAPPAAVVTPDAPGLNVEDLAARLRDAVMSTSGVDVVDEISVRRELAACEEMPCPDAVAERYRGAAFVVASSVSRLGDVYLSTVRVQRGAEELARTTAQASDARTSLESAGRSVGALLRTRLLADGVLEKQQESQ